MPRIFLFLLSVSPSFHIRFFFFALALLAVFAAPASAQQNLFNVPSGVITPKDELFFQQQFNIGRLSGTSNTSTAFGLGDGWEAGINLLDLYMYDHSGTTDDSLPTASVQGNPDFMVNLQKGVELTDFWSSAIGTQAGFNPTRRTNHIQFQNFTWWVNSFEAPGHEAWGKWYLGAFFANHAYAGSGNRTGAMLGCEIPIVKNKLSFQADALLGDNDLSVAVLGAVYTFDNRWQLSLGAQIPMPNSGNAHGIVVEFTYPGFPFHRKNR